ncbi:MAG: CoA transferase [Gammaproteobacteria bacterium]|nr:CoA transferase [Gammaproteobacteria bacterium]
MTLAFQGVRVVDFTQVLAGPFATQQLAQLGADVIKIEERKAGDQTRGLLGSDGTVPGMSPSFITCNVGKRSLALDLKNKHAETIVNRLISRADVIVENFRPGVMKRLGFDYASCVALKSDLVYCSISGYGQQGPKSAVAAYDGAIQADSGMMACVGTPDSGPLRTGYMHVDMSTALNAAFAISAALYRRAATGDGQYLDVAMMDTAIVMQAAQYSKYLHEGEMPGRIGNQSPTGQPTANVFATSDGFLQVLALRESQVEKLFEVLGCPEQLTVPGFQTSDARLAHFEPVSAFVADRFSAHSTQHWYEALLHAGVPVSLVRDFDQVRADPQFAGRNVFHSMASPFDATTVTAIGSGYIADRDSPAIKRAPPSLGEHTNEVLREVEFDEDQIDLFRKAGAV